MLEYVVIAIKAKKACRFIPGQQVFCTDKDEHRNIDWTTNMFDAKRFSNIEEAKRWLGKQKRVDMSSGLTHRPTDWYVVFGDSPEVENVDFIVVTLSQEVASTEPETEFITPSDNEIRAVEDKEYSEYLRLSQKYGK